MMTRRQALKTTALITAACAVPPLPEAAAQPAAAVPFTLPALPYPFDALEPHIDARTMEIHHDKHHAAYVTNLNKALADHPDLGKKPIETLLKDINSAPEAVRTAIRNQGGGHYNHTLFWQMMKKGGGGEPKGELATMMARTFGSYGDFKAKFTDAATKVFGSGWAWLALTRNGLEIRSTPNQDALIMPDPGQDASAPRPQPLLGLDVWEHAYYLKYQNRRPEYIAAWFNVINWDFVAERLAQLKA